MQKQAQTAKTAKTTTTEVDRDYLASLFAKVDLAPSRVKPISERLPKASALADWATTPAKVTGAVAPFVAPETVQTVPLDLGAKWRERRANLDAEKAERAALDARHAAKRAAKVAKFQAEEKAKEAAKPAPSASVSIRVGDIVWYTSNAGKRNKYKVVQIGAGCSYRLEWLWGKKGAKKTRFWAKGAQIEDLNGQMAAAKKTRGGGRICICGDRSCGIGPFQSF